MKKVLFAMVVGIISTLAGTNGIAQTSNKIAKYEYPGRVVVNDGLLPAAVNPKAAEDINIKALNNLRKYYQDASNVKWTKTKGSIVADFESNGIRIKVFYDLKGRWEGSIKNYHEEKFNPAIRGIVKSKYYDYKIFYVQEIETFDTIGQPTYLAYIEDDHNFKIVRIWDFNMDTYQEFSKQN